MRRVSAISALCVGALLPFSFLLPVAPAASAAPAADQALPPVSPPGALAYTTYGGVVVTTSATGTRPVHATVPALAPDTTTSYGDVEYSADGDRVALTTSRGLVLSDPQFSAVTLVSPTPLSDVEWVPGSSQSLYGASGAKLVRLDLRPGANATVTTVATLPEGIGFVRPSQDGRWVGIYLANRYAEDRILLVDLRDGSVRTVPTSGYQLGAPGWDAASGRLLYSVEQSSPFARVLRAVDPETLADTVVVPSLPNSIAPAGEDNGAGQPYLLDALGRGSGRPTLYTVDVATGALTTLGDLPQFGYRSMFGDLDLGSAPDGVDQVGTCAGFTATIEGTDGDDTLTGTPGDDVILAGAGDDTVDGRGGDDVVCGGPGDDTLTDTSGDNRLYGGDGDDHLTTGAGADLVGGDGGADVIDAGDGANSVTGGDGDDRITTGSGADSVRGGPGADHITTGDGDDLVFPGRGIVGFPAHRATAKAAAATPVDVLDTGAGDDVVDNANVLVTADLGDGDDRLTGARYVFGSEVAVTVVAGRGDDQVRAGGATVDGGPGDDVVGGAYYADGGPGHDILGGATRHVTAGKVYRGGPGDDTIYGAESMEGGDGNDTISGLYNNVSATGGAGNDRFDFVRTVDAGPGDDVVTNATTVHGDDGNDTISLRGYVGMPTTPSADGGPGDDDINGSGVADVLSGGSGDDTIQGKAGDDTIHGDSGRDKLSGGYDEDALDGGTGTDLCHPDGDVTPLTSCEILLPRA